MVIIAAISSAEEKTIRNSNYKHLFVLLLQNFKQPLTQSIGYELKRAEKLEKT